MIAPWKQGRPHWQQERGDIQFPYAYDAGGTRAEARTAPRQAPYTCLACQQPMRLRRGEVRRAYFAHVERNSHCSPEKALRDLASATIAEAWRAALAAGAPYRVGWTCPCGKRMTGNLTLRSRTVEEWRRTGRAQPDIVGVDATGLPSVVVEVLVNQELAATVPPAYQRMGLSLLCVYPAWDDLAGLTEGLETVWVEAPLWACSHPAPPPRPQPWTPPARPAPRPSPRQAPPPAGVAGVCPSCSGPRQRVLLEAWVRELPCWGAGCGQPVTTLHVEEGAEPGLRLTTPAAETHRALCLEVARCFGLVLHPQVGKVVGERLLVAGCPFCRVGQGVHVVPFAARPVGGVAPTWQAWGGRCATCGDWTWQEVRRKGAAVPLAC